MANYPVISTSSDGKLIQVIGEVDAQNAKVVHYLKLDAAQNAVFGDLNIYKDSDPGTEFVEKCAEYGVNPKHSDILVEFIYDLLADPSRPNREVKAFPLGGGYYTIPTKPKVVAVATMSSPTNVVSHTAGEAL
ncbi:MAG: hypothetical protein ABFS05_10090 [Bacteroidota bacterium]